MRNTRLEGEAVVFGGDPYPWCLQKGGGRKVVIMAPCRHAGVTPGRIPTVTDRECHAIYRGYCGVAVHGVDLLWTLTWDSAGDGPL